jgi:hypothetical protein
MPNTRHVQLCIAIVIAFAGHESAVASLSIDAPLLPIFSEIFGRSQRADRNREVAAFVSRDNDGEYRCTLWPSHFSWRTEQFSGVTPPATFALVHTHPKGLERPSQNDVAECMRTGYTFYVITFWQIYRIEPATGVIVTVIWNQDWTRDFRVKTTTGKVCREQSAGR